MSVATSMATQDFKMADVFISNLDEQIRSRPEQLGESVVEMSQASYLPSNEKNVKWCQCLVCRCESYMYDDCVLDAICVPERLGHGE